MKDLKAFAKEVSSDKNLAQKVSKAKNAKDVVSIAADNGYSFDESDLMKVSGGNEEPKSYVGDINLGFDFSKIDASIKQEIKGMHNTGQNTGSVNIKK